jgi:hypothetical protein
MCGLEVNVRVRNRGPFSGRVISKQYVSNQTEQAFTDLLITDYSGAVGRGSRTAQSLPGVARLESKT